VAFLWLHRPGDQFNRTQSYLVIVDVGNDYRLVDRSLRNESLQPCALAELVDQPILCVGDLSRHDPPS
jgi:hypothetical protein